MPALTFTNLLIDTGVTTTPTTQSFRANMPGGPLANGESMQRWHVESVDDVMRDFGSAVILPYTQVIHWDASYSVGELPDRITQFTSITANVTASDIYDDFGTARPGTITIATAGVSINTTTRMLTFTGTITNTRQVASHGSIGGGNFYHSCTLTLTFTAGPNFNGPKVTSVADVKIETEVIGGSAPPTAPLITPFAYNSGSDRRLQWSAAGGILSSGGPWTYEWATDSLITTVVSTSSLYDFIIAPGTEHAIYLRLQNSGGYSPVYFGYYDDPGEPA